MIPAKFDYVRPKSISEAMMLLAQQDKKTAILAGGHSLLTQLKQRKRHVDLVVDLASLGLEAVSIRDEVLSIGAMAKQHEVSLSVLSTKWELLSEIASAAADPMIRTRGTVVGALCALEPGGDWAPAALVLDAQLSILHSDHEEICPYSDLLEMESPFPPTGSIVTGASFAAPPEDAMIGYRKFKHSSIGWSVVSVAYSIAATSARIAVSGALERPTRLRQLEQFLETNPRKTIDAQDLDPVLDQSLTGLNFRSDGYASAKYRKHRLKLMLRDIVLASTNANNSKRAAK